MTEPEADLRSPRARRLRRAVLKRIVLLIGVEMLLFGCSSTLADRLLLHPTRHDIPPAGERRTLDVNGESIELFVAESSREQPAEFVICAFTGNAGRAELQVEATRQLFVGACPGRSFEVIAMQWPGYGGSEGEASLEAFAECASAAFDYASERAGGRPVIVHAVSMGTTAGLHLAAEVGDARNGRFGLLLEKPPSLISQIYSHGWWNLWLLALPVASGVPSTARSVELAARVRAPAVFVIADGDRVVPPKFSREVRAAYGGESRLVEMAGGHNDPLTRSRAPERDEALAWLLEACGG